MRRLTDIQRDDAARWFGLARRYGRVMANRRPWLADAINGAVGRAAVRVASSPDPSPWRVWMSLRTEVQTIIRSEIDHRRAWTWATSLVVSPCPTEDDRPTPALDALATLPPRQRLAVKLCVIDGLSIGQAAEIMNVSLGNVWTTRKSALAKLRTLLQESA